MKKLDNYFFVIGQDENQVNITEFIKKYQPGGMMYRPDQAEKIKREIATAQTTSKIPMLFAANLESGGNGIVTEGTWFGNPLQMAATDDSHSAYELGNVSGEEAAQVGNNMSFAPIVDIDKNFRNPIMNTRTFGSDKNRVIRMADAQIKGLKDNKIIPVIKHFPGDGVDDRDQHLVSSVNSLSADDWMNSYGEIYHHLIDAGIPSIMIAHIMQPAWERKLKPGIEDKDLLPATINAGIDMILFNKNIDEDYRFIHEAIDNGTLSIKRVDEAVTRILGTKLAQGIMNTNGELTLLPPKEINLHSAEHQKLAEEVAKKSVTLVKDRDQLLPLTPKKYPHVRLVVLGDSDDGGFKEGGHVTQAFKDALEKEGFKVTLFDRKKLDFHEMFEEGVEDMKKKFDLAFYVANVETASNQTTTRLDWIHLMAADSPWYMKSIPTVFVSTANPYHLYDIPNVSTFINAYTGNQASIDAIMRKVTGKEKFEGKNPVDPFCGDFTTKL